MPTIPPGRDDTFLLTRFRELYHEVLRQKRRLEAAGPADDELEADLEESYLSPAVEPGSAAETEQPADGSAADVDPSGVHERLLALLERQAVEASRSPEAPAAPVAEEARYAMAALVDEVFLNLDWAGRDWWRGHLLEARLFKTHRAGERVFERIDALLGDPERGSTDLARLYLLLLGLGFEGRFRGLEGAEEELCARARRLHGFLAGREEELRNGDRPLFPAAYAYTLGEGRGARLPHLRPWLLAAAGLAALWLLVAHGLWWSLTSDLQVTLSQALEAMF